MCNCGSVLCLRREEEEEDNLHVSYNYRLSVLNFKRLAAALRSTFLCYHGTH